MEIRSLLSYNLYKGEFHIMKNDKVKRRIFPNEDGYLIFYRNTRRIKLKANRIAIELGTNIPEIPADCAVLHKNLDENDYRLCNLRVIDRSTFNLIKEASRNLSGALKMQVHPTEVYSYILIWKENGRERKKTIKDIVVAKRQFNKLQLKYAKILSTYCVFD